MYMSVVSALTSLRVGVVPGDINGLSKVTVVVIVCIFSFPVTIKDGAWTIVEGIEHNDFAKERIAATSKELSEERETVKDLLQG